MLLFYLCSSWSCLDFFLCGFRSCSIQFVARLPFCLFCMCFLLLLFSSSRISSLLQLSVYLSHFPTYHLSSHSSTKLSSSLSPPPLDYPLVYFPTSRIHSFLSILSFYPAINIYISPNLLWPLFLSPTSLLLPLPEVLAEISSSHTTS